MDTETEPASFQNPSRSKRAITPLAQLPDQSATLATCPRVVEVARATEQKIDSILDAAEQQDASDVFLQENEVPRLKINEPDRIGFGYGIEDG
jgi:hypothetical protein